MPAARVQALLEDIRLVSAERHDLVQAVRDLAKQSLGTIGEEVKYGGILFSSGGVPFGGVFAYKQHVSVEFSHGASIQDPHGHLEGAGKGRRHVKLRAKEDVVNKHVAEYLRLALQATGSGS